MVVFVGGCILETLCDGGGDGSFVYCFGRVLSVSSVSVVSVRWWCQSVGGVTQSMVCLVCVKLESWYACGGGDSTTN